MVFTLAHLQCVVAVELLNVRQARQPFTDAEFDVGLADLDCRFRVEVRAGGGGEERVIERGDTR